ncbi:MAG: DNA internalization-related competence protein ComEC/Rec2 [Acidobacteriota bacterium]
MDKPFVPLFATTLSVLFFIYFFNIQHFTLPTVFFMFFILSLSFFLLKKFKISYILIIFAISVLIGHQFVLEKDNYNKMRLLQITGPQYIKVSGKLIRFPEAGIGKSSIRLRTKWIDDGKQKKNITVNLKIVVKGDTSFLNRGETILIDTIIRENHFFRNFFENPMEEYQFLEKIHFTGYTKSALLIESIRETNYLWKITGWMRRRIKKTIESLYLNKDGALRAEGQLLEALLLGERGRLENSEKKDLLDSGIFHLFAISGAHIGIISLFSLFFLKTFKVKRRRRYFFTIIILLSFLVLTGFKISAQRAVLMAVLIFISKIYFMETDIFNIISAVGIAVLINNPSSFLSPGFILTFSITSGIVAGRKIFFEKPEESSSYVKELTSASLSASMISLPLSLYFFLRYSFSGFFAGFIFLPLTGIIMSLSIIVLPVSLISISAAKILLLFSSPFIKAFFGITHFFSRSLNLTIYRPPPKFYVVLLFLIIFFFTTGFIQKNRKNRVIIFMILTAFLILLSIKPPRYTPEYLEVYFLDVGQGDSQVIVFPGGDSLLIDGGGSYFSDFEIGQSVVLPFLIQKRIDIKWIAITHFHPDHCRGILEILDVIRPEEIWISSAPYENRFYRDILDKIRAPSRLRNTDRSFFKTSGKSTINILFPEKFLKPFYSHNNHSLVIKIDDPFNSFLFTGDIEKEAENKLVNLYKKELNSSILKVPHHGSRTSSTFQFLKNVMPEFSVFSLGKNNRFGFPHKEVVRAYEKVNSKLLFTSERGGIMIRSSPECLIFEFSKYPDFK